MPEHKWYMVWGQNKGAKNGKIEEQKNLKKEQKTKLLIFRRQRYYCTYNSGAKTHSRFRISKNTHNEKFLPMVFGLR